MADSVENRAPSIGYVAGMFCPRCGEETDAAARYCGSCGAELPKPGEEGADAEKRSIRERLGNLAGRTRRERIVTAGTVLAIAVAIGAFFALDTETGEDDLPAGLSRSDAEAVDAACIVTKQSISEAAGKALRGGEANLEAYSSAVLRAIVQFRSQVRSLGARSLDPLEAALLDAAAEAGELSRLAREDPSKAPAQAQALEDATGAVEREIEALGLTGCSRQATAPIAPR
jgi:hypothetical protein